MSVLEISELGCHIAKYRGFITLSVKGQEVNRIPFDHISSIITKAHGITYTQGALVELAKRNIPVVIVDKSFMPVSIMQPIGAHHATMRQLSAQIGAAKSQNNLLWQKLIRAKIRWQIAVLEQLQIHHGLTPLLEQVNSGDTRNVEAQAARKYWTLLLGSQFKRKREGHTPNEMLNYGYTIFRSELARQICAAGLHPAIGIHHKHPLNTFCLADDLLEPFRAIVDYAVYKLLEHGEHELNASTKKVLVTLLEQVVKTNGRWLSISDAMKSLVQSLSKAYLDESTKLNLAKADASKIKVVI